MTPAIDALFPLLPGLKFCSLIRAFNDWRFSVGIGFEICDDNGASLGNVMSYGSGDTPYAAYEDALNKLPYEVEREIASREARRAAKAKTTAPVEVEIGGLNLTF